MSRIFITGSSDGLGLMAAQLLVEQGHSVVLHARNAERAEVTRRRLPGTGVVVTGDLASLQQMVVADTGSNRRLQRNHWRKQILSDLGGLELAFPPQRRCSQLMSGLGENTKRISQLLPRRLSAKTVGLIENLAFCGNLGWLLLTPLKKNITDD